MALDKNGIEIPTFEQASAELNSRAAALAPKVIMDTQGAQLPVDDQGDLSRAIMSDEYAVNPDDTFYAKKYDGTVMAFPGKHIKQVLQSGDYILESKEETQLRQDEKKYGANNLEAAALGASRGLTFGLSDQFFKEGGFYTGDELRGKENANKVMSIGGEVLGAVAPALLSGGTSLAARGAGTLGAGVLASEQLGASVARKIAISAAEKQAVRKAALEAGEKLAASEASTAINVANEATQAIKAGASAVSDDVAAKSTNLFSKSLEKAGYASTQAKNIAQNMLYGGLEHMAPEAANLAVQGALQGAGRLVTEDAFGTAEFNAENLLAYAGVGSLVGGTFGASIGLGKALVPKISDLAAPAIGKIEGAITGAMDSVVGKEKSALNLVDLTPASLAKARLKRPDFDKLLTKEVDDILRVEKPKSYGDFDEAIIKKHGDLGKKIGSIYKEADDIIAKNVAEEATNVGPVGLNSEVLTGNLQRAVDDYLAKLGTAVTATEKKSLFNIADDFIGNVSKDLADKPVTATTLKKYADDLADRIYPKSKGPTLLTAEEQSATMLRKSLRDAIKQEQMNIVQRASEIQSGGRVLGGLLDNLIATNKSYSVLSDVVYNSQKSLAKEALSGGLKSAIPDIKDLAVGMTGGFTGAVAFKAARMASESFAVQKRLAMGALDNSGRKLMSGIKAGLGAMGKGTAIAAKAAEPSIVRSLVSSQLAVKTVDGKKQKPKNEEEAYNNIIENANKAVVDPESVLQHSNRQTAAMFEHAPNTAAAIDAKYLQMLQFIASKTKKSKKNTGIFDITKSIKPSGFEMAKIARYVDAISNPHTMLSKAAQGKLSREHVEVMKSIFPEMHNKLKEATLKHITENKAEMKYAQKLQLGLLLDMQAHESMQPQNIQALQSQFSADAPETDNTQYNQGAVGKMSKASGLASDTEQHEIGD